MHLEVLDSVPWWTIGTWDQWSHILLPVSLNIVTTTTETHSLVHLACLRPQYQPLHLFIATVRLKLH
jgi:hypothetical protein